MMNSDRLKERLIAGVVFGFLMFLCGAGVVAQGGSRLSGVAKEAADELWRRGVCMLSSVVEPAKRASEVPTELRGAEVVCGRPLSMANEIRCFVKDKERIWAASDSAVYAVDAGRKELVRVYTPGDGLPDEPVDSLICDGRFLWLVQRSGLAALDLESDRFVTEGMPKFSHAQVISDKSGAWLVADTGTYIYSHEDGGWTNGPALPTGEEIGRFVAKGMWEGRRGETLRGLLGEPVVLGEDLYIPSRGSLYRFEGGSRRWSKVSGDAWKAVGAQGRLFFIGAFGVGEYDPATGKMATYKVGEDIPDGRPTFLVVVGGNVWVALDAQGLSESYGEGKGGVARFDLKTGKWTSYREINGQRADQVTALEEVSGRLWCATQKYTEVETIVAHPGMAHIKRSRPKVEGLSLHAYDSRQDKWDTITLPMPEGEPQMILGQRGTYNEGRMVPRRLVAIAAASPTIVCEFDMYPIGYYSGYYPSIGLFAERKGGDDDWKALFVNHAGQLHLQGEQPSVLLISGSHGHRIVMAAGHKKVLGLFRHEAGNVWAVTEGCVAWFDESEKRWHAVVEQPYRFYWRATAAAGDDKYVWIGSDCGVISRMNRETYEVEALVCLPKRKVTHLAFDSEKTLWVRTDDSECRRLPVELEGVRKGPGARVVKFDGKEWAAAEGWPSGVGAPEREWELEGRRNFILRKTRSNPSGERVFFLTGVFRPEMLFEDKVGRCLWISTYCGLVKLPIDK